MIDKKSRYRKTSIVEVPRPGGERVRLLELREVPTTTGTLEVTPVSGERLDHLAHRFYRDPRKFWRICDASEHLDPYDVVAPGEPLVIPPGD
jgi:hypothetical protein